MTSDNQPRLFRSRLEVAPGTAVARAVEGLRGAIPDADELLETLRDVEWADEPAAIVIKAITARSGRGRRPNAAELKGWVEAHLDRPDNVVACLVVEPPDQVQIISVLSNAGSQKRVFLGRWLLTDRLVVLKQFLNPLAAEAVLLRELQPHPLSMEHRNIIETHKLTNENQEHFLVERHLHALSDAQWRNVGAAESANLLHDIASALSFVHDRGRVHGDVKPDNIGYEEGRYLLLDFGICRPPDQFTEKDPTGSLRTRAPELLLGTGTHSEASDVWALGATVFHGIVGRFPLYDPEEPTPQFGEDPEGRSALARALRRRAESEWLPRINDAVEQVEPPRLRKLLRRALARDPQDRPQARELAAQCRSQLAALVRAADAPGWLGHRDRIAQLHDFLPPADVLRQLPERRQDELRDELRQLRTFPGLPIEEVRRVDGLLVRLTDDGA